MAQAVGKVQNDVASGALPPNDVSPKHIEQHLYTEVYFLTHELPPPCSAL